MKTGSNRRRIWASSSAIFSVALALAVGFTVSRRSSNRHEAAAATPRTSHASLPAPLPAGQAAEPTEPTLTGSAAAKLEASSLSLSQQVNRLALTGKPADYFKAYRISANCQLNREWRSSVLSQPDGSQISKLALQNLPSIDETCGDLTPGQIASRISFLRIAAEAGVHGAITALVAMEGPQGIFRSIPDSEDYRRLQAAAAEAALRTADPDALQGKSEEYFNNEKTPEGIAQALKYWVASKEARALDAGTKVAEEDAVAARYASVLPQSLAKQAIEDGKTLVASARSQK